MAVKVDRCFGCKVCTIACKSENYAQFVANPANIVEEDPIFWIKVHSEMSGSYPRFRALYYPLLCRHCQNPLCVEACPTEAISKTQDGVVLINQDECNGCDLCITACPYQVPQHNPRTSKAEMCHFCLHRLEQGKAPICVLACPSKALAFGDLNDRNSEISRLVSSRKSLSFPPDSRSFPSVYWMAAG